MQWKADYLKWIADTVGFDERYNPICYTMLLWDLSEQPFKVENQNDRNRLVNGWEMRVRIVSDVTGKDIEYVKQSLPFECSVLDIMIDLAIRCERDVVGDDDFGISVSALFWNMVECMGLDEMTDDKYNFDYVKNTLVRFVNRQYERNGFGGLFITSNPNIDMRLCSIWDQMMLHLNELYYP